MTIPSHLERPARPMPWLLVGVALIGLVGPNLHLHAGPVHGSEVHDIPHDIDTHDVPNALDPQIFEASAVLERLAAPMGRRLEDALATRWPDHPEWLAMLVDILQGSQLGPRDGWFPKAASRTRFGWEFVRNRYDRNDDNLILPAETPTLDDDAFDRLDRDHNGVLTEADFAFDQHALTYNPGVYLFDRADADADGRVSREELLEILDQMDPEGLGFASLNDLRDLFQPPAPTPPLPAIDAEDNDEGEANDTAPNEEEMARLMSGPSMGTLIRGLFAQEIGALRPGPDLGEPAPDFTLTTVDGEQTVRLADRVGPRPIVLIFGNFTCGPFRVQAGNVEKLYRRYADRAEFLMVYVREAHPTGGWRMASNERAGVAIAQPETYGRRVEVAEVCRQTLGFPMPMLVDTLDDAVGGRYSGMPSRLYLIDRDGRVAYKSGRGPFGFKPDELESALILHLDETREADDND